MMWRNNSERYGQLSIAMHWLMLLLLAAVFACIELRELYPKGSEPREALKAWHFTLGLTVFVLVWLRLALRLGAPTPRIEPAPASWQQLSAKAVHLLLYVLMIGLPIGGWLMLSAAGKPIPFWGVQLPAIVAENKALAEQVKELHALGGEIGLWLVGLHAAAALFHHYVLRDNTLRRMLPERR